MDEVNRTILGGKRGIDVLHDPEINKSTAFTEAEREALGLTGLLPSGIDTEEIQVERVMQHLGTKSTDLGRYIYLIGLLDTNESLFYNPRPGEQPVYLPGGGAGDLRYQTPACDR
jgi:malate dehydrogenase (oxaloacetate-decarboxylating)(NADP+)